MRGHDQLRTAFRSLFERRIRWGKHEPVAVRDHTMFVEYRRESGPRELRDAVDVLEMTIPRAW